MSAFQTRLMMLSMLGGVFAATPAFGCRDSDPIEPNSFLSADLVVVGQISNYREVLDPYWRRQIKADPKSNQGYASDFVRFDVQVEQVLIGIAPPQLSVTWDAGWMGEPNSLQGEPYLIGLRYPKSNPPWTRPASEVDPDPIVPTVISTGCGGDLFVESNSELGGTIRKLIASQGKRKRPSRAKSPE